MLLLAALARGETEVRDLLASDDTQVMLEALEQLSGVGMRSEAEGVLASSVAATGPSAQVRRRFPRYLGKRPAATAAGGDQAGGVVRSSVDRCLVDGFGSLPASSALPTTRRSRRRGSVNVSSELLTGFQAPATDRRRDHALGGIISKPLWGNRFGVMQSAGGAAGRQRFYHPAGSRYVSPGTIYGREGDASSASYFLAAGAIGGTARFASGASAGSIQGDLPRRWPAWGSDRDGDNWIAAKWAA